MKLLALDIGSYSIKSLYLEGKYGRFKLLGYAVTSLPVDPSLSRLELVTKSVAGVVASHGYTPDKTLVMYPSDKTTYHFVTLPFRDKNRIALTLPYELEEQFPFLLEDIIFDWKVVETVAKTSKVCVAISSKTDISLYLDALKAAGLDPDLLSPDSDCLHNLSSLLKLGEQIVEIKKDDEVISEKTVNPVLILDIGHSKTNLIISKNGVPKNIRTIAYGGAYITKRIIEEYNISYEEAERFKFESSYIILDDDMAAFTENQVKFSDLLKESYDIIIRDVNQTLSSFKAAEKEGISNGFILGCGWQVKNFDKYIEQELKINFQNMPYLGPLKLDLPFSSQSDENAMANAVGLTLKYTQRSSIKLLNLRKGEFSKVKEAEGGANYLELFKPTIRNLIIGLCLLFVYGFAHSFILDGMENSYKEEIATKFKTAFPEKSKRDTERSMEDYDSLLKIINERLRIQKTFLEGDIAGDLHSSLDVLMELSKAIPKDTVVDIEELQIVKNMLKIVKGKSPNSSVVKEIANSLDASGKFTDIKEGNIRIAVDGVNKEFELMATYKGKNK